MISGLRFALRGWLEQRLQKNDAIGYDSANGVGARKDSATLAGWFTGFEAAVSSARTGLVRFDGSKAKLYVAAISMF